MHSEISFYAAWTTATFCYTVWPTFSQSRTQLFISPVTRSETDAHATHCFAIFSSANPASFVNSSLDTLYGLPTTVNYFRRAAMCITPRLTIWCCTTEMQARHSCRSTSSLAHSVSHARTTRLLYHRRNFSSLVAYRPSASPASSLKPNRGSATTALDPGGLQGFSGSSGVLSNAFGHSDILHEYSFNE